jgi:hypothetical protein
MAFLEDLFNWMDSKVEQVNTKNITEKLVHIQDRTKEKLAPLITRNTLDRKTRKELSKTDKELHKVLQNNYSEQEWAENERSNQLDINDYEKDTNHASNNIKQRRIILNIHKSLLALHQKFVSLKHSTITENDKKDIDKLFTNIQINMGVLPTLRPYSDDFVRMIMSINDIVSSQGINSGTINVLIDLSNGALTKFNVLKTQI